MSLAIDERVSDKELVERITSKEVTEFDLMREFQISNSALRKYKTNTSATKVRKSEPRRKLLLLDFSLSFLEEQGLDNPFDILKSVYVDETPLLKFINENAKERLVVLILKEVLKSKIKDVATKPIDRYREKYEYLNDETLAMATNEAPDLLKELIEDTNLRPSTRGDILEALAIGGRSDLYEYVKSKTEEKRPHLREAAFIGLFEYFDSDPEKYDLRDFFEERYKKENADGVKLTIANLLEEMHEEMKVA